MVKVKLYTKAVNSCMECPYYIDEGGWCRHPSRASEYHVVLDWHRIPGDCPLPDVELSEYVSLRGNNETLY